MAIQEYEGGLGEPWDGKSDESQRTTHQTSLEKSLLEQTIHYNINKIIQL
jgi:hypothetical protein